MIGNPRKSESLPENHLWLPTSYFLLFILSSGFWYPGDNIANIPSNVIELIGKQGTVKVLATANKAGKPHAIVAGSIMSPKPDTMIIAEILMKVSVNNLNENKKATFVISSGMESYEIECTAKARLDKGPELDNMNEVLAGMHLKANALWVFDVDAVYNQGAGPDCGKKVA